MGCKHSKQNVAKVNKDVEVSRKLQIGLHLTKGEAGVQVAFGKTSRKKYELPEVVRREQRLRATRNPAETSAPAEPAVPAVDDSDPAVREVMRRDD